MHSSEPEPADAGGEHPASALVLAAVQRAVLHAPQPGAPASTAAVLRHLGISPRSAAARRALQTLRRLHAVGMLACSHARGRTRWSPAARGRVRLRALRGASATAALPESPQHRTWSEARAAAERETDRFRGDLADALCKLETLSRSEPPAGSDALLAAAARVHDAARRLASAVHCLHEWAEPGDEAADVDACDEPAGPGARHLPPARLAALRAGRRNLRLWDQPRD